MLRRVVIAGLLTVGLAQVVSAPARADFLPQYSIEQTPNPIPLTPTNWDQSTPSLSNSNPFEIQKFDPSAHVLDGVTPELFAVGVKFDYNIQSTVVIRFDNDATITVEAEGKMHLFGPDGNDLVGAPGFLTQVSLTPTPGQGFPQSVTQGPKTISGSSGQGFFDATTLGWFTGTGTISLPVAAASTSTFTSSSGNGFGGAITAASAGLTVTYYYHYLPVPEPTSLVLTGLGGAGLLLVCRPRGRRASSTDA